MELEADNAGITEVLEKSSYSVLKIDFDYEIKLTVSVVLNKENADLEMGKMLFFRAGCYKGDISQSA